MHFLIYRVSNIINEKSYVGAHQTHDKNDGYMGSGTAIKAAIKRYGADAFKKEIIFEASSKEEMFVKEKEFVVIGPSSYNLVSGGITGTPFGIARREEVRAKISASKKGKPVSPEHRAKLRTATLQHYEKIRSTKKNTL